MCIRDSYSNGLMSKRTVLDELQRGGVLDPDLRIDDELERIDEDHEEKQEQMMADSEDKLQVEMHRAEEMQKIQPEKPAANPVQEFKGSSKKKTEQEKTEQAAKVAK